MIPPLGSIPPLTPPTPPAAAGPSSAAGAAAVGSASPQAPGGSPATGFGNLVTGALDSVQQVQSNASLQAAQVAAGQGNVADALIASTQASLATQVTTAVTNRAIEAFTQVMNMQL